MSQSQLAAAAGVPFRSLQNWEQGHRPVSLNAASKIADALGVSLDELVGREPPAKKKGGQ
jgi:transcriptional regulator with XRE-family HTH domain